MMPTLNKNSNMKRHSFTLIELLIVIGLMGALTALILPTVTANREEALGDVCDYNQAGTVRTLKQYENIVGSYPADMHNGLQTAVDAATAMPGLPAAQTDHMGNASDACPSLHLLTDHQANSLSDAGITSICYGEGLQSENIPYAEVPTETLTDFAVVIAHDGTDPWADDEGNEMTFDGISITDWMDGNNTPSWDGGKSGEIVVLWITPTVDWSAGDADNNDWSQGNVTMGIDMEGQCPIPTAAASGGEVTFPYYMAYFKVYDDGTPARMIGSTCPECGVLNP